MSEAPLTYEEYRLLVEQAPILIWRANTTTACDYFNERWLAFTGRTLAQEVGNGWAEGVHPDDFDRCLEIYLAAFGKRETFEMVYRLKRHDGVFRHILDRGVPCFDSDGAFKGYIGSCIDITEKVEAEAELQRAREKEMTRLRGMLPICANCKQIRDDQGYWHCVEVYIREHSDADFSHSLCPACIATLYPEYAPRLTKRR